MMRNTYKLLRSLVVASALLPFCASAQTIVYDNSDGDLNRTYLPQPNTNGVAFGDQINLDGTDRVVMNFKFEYFLSGNASGDEAAQLFFYANDGQVIEQSNPDGSTFQVTAPGTLLYTSPVLSLQTGFQTADASGFEIAVPDSFTWAVTFTGIQEGEVAGLRVYDPPSVGSSFADFWQRNNGTWNTYLFDNPPGPANFAARVTAVPEPTTIAYALLAGAACIGYLSRKRRS
jgi:hypothetical protein